MISCAPGLGKLMKYFVLFSFIALNALAHLAQADLPNCTDTQVVEAVCGDNFGAHHQDDTGTGISFHDFKNATPGIQTKITDEGYLRFKNAFAKVIEAYRQIIPQISDGNDRLFLTSQLNKVRTPSHRHLNTNPLSSWLLGANGMYNPVLHEIMITPEILNAPGLSSIELEMLIAHELGHYMDPNQHPLNMLTHLTLDPREKVLSAAYNSCFEKDFSLWPHSPTFEDYADWMASKVAPVLAASSDAATYLSRALNLGYVMCEKTTPSNLEDLLSGKIGPEDAHSVWPDRILTFLKDPKLLEAIGCGQTILRANSAKAYDRCEF
jgi:hypothetical protein